jgi:hypothetical protein
MNATVYAICSESAANSLKDCRNLPLQLNLGKECAIIAMMPPLFRQLLLAQAGTAQIGCIPDARDAALFG